MENQTKLNIAVILTLIATLTYVGVSEMTDTPTHYCEERQIKAYCYELSSTMKTCYTLPGKIGGKRCDIWKEIPEPEITEVSSGYSGKEYICPKRPNPCKIIKR